jgi:DNA-binding CsgD family transcriptional regulator
MNRPRPEARIVVRARDPLLRSQIEERLAGLGDVSVTVDVFDSDPGVTPREIQVLGLLAEGLANKEIAGRLAFSVHTAKFHVESLLKKLAAANRAEAVKEGIRLGLIGV